VRGTGTDGPIVGSASQGCLRAVRGFSAAEGFPGGRLVVTPGGCGSGGPFRLPHGRCAYGCKPLSDTLLRTRESPVLLGGLPEMSISTVTTFRSGSYVMVRPISR
jgi:hypothetical protein